MAGCWFVSRRESFTPPIQRRLRSPWFPLWLWRMLTAVSTYSKTSSKDDQLIDINIDINHIHQLHTHTHTHIPVDGEKGLFSFVLDPDFSSNGEWWPNRLPKQNRLFVLLLCCVWKERAQLFNAHFVVMERTRATVQTHCLIIKIVHFNTHALCRLLLRLVRVIHRVWQEAPRIDNEPIQFQCPIPSDHRGRLLARHRWQLSGEYAITFSVW